jgi:hypothetical protein
LVDPLEWRVQHEENAHGEESASDEEEEDLEVELAAANRDGRKFAFWQESVLYEVV